MLYRVFDADGALLYIGATVVGPSRFDQHAATQPWWTTVARIEMTHYESRAEAFAAESDAIFYEQPFWNRLGKTRTEFKPAKVPQSVPPVVEDGARNPNGGGSLFNRWALNELLRCQVKTPAELAQHVGISSGYISDLRSGNKQSPTRQTVSRIADFVGVPADALEIDPDVPFNRAALAAFLKYQGVSLATLANLRGASRGYLSDLLNGNKTRPKSKTVRRIAEALDIDSRAIYCEVRVEAEAVA